MHVKTFPQSLPHKRGDEESGPFPSERRRVVSCSFPGGKKKKHRVEMRWRKKNAGEVHPRTTRSSFPCRRAGRSGIRVVVRCELHGKERGACQEGKRHSLQLRINKEAMEINRMLIRVIIVLEFSFSSVYILF